MKPSIVIASFFASYLAASVSDACQPCAGWWDWGHREAVCASPSEGLWDDELACLCSGAGASGCVNWCASYDACSVSGDPSCTIPDDPSCDAAMSVGGACHTEAFACGADHTGCATCSQWLGGADPQGLCPSTGGPPDSIDPAINLSDCACGLCSGCASACTLGYFDPTAAGFMCGLCIGNKCASQYGACSGA